MSLGLELMLLDLASERDRRRRRNELRSSSINSLEMSHADFVKAYRLTKELVEDLLIDLNPLIPIEKRCDALSLQTKLLITLAFFATGSYQNIVGQSMYHFVSQPTVSRAIQQITAALNHSSLFNKYVYFPRSRDERDKIKLRFYERFRMPGVIGCIDGTHVGIIRPSLHEERYYNRKGYHSLNVMIICDTDLNILCIDPSNPGSTHDSVIWRDHPLNHYINEKYDSSEVMYLLGDSGYPLRKTMMTPFLNAVDGSPESNYYNLQVTARNTVERCIGVLKARFRCLLVARKLHYNPLTAAQMVNACAILHNIAVRANLAVPNLTEEVLNEERELNITSGEHQMQIEGAPTAGRGNVELLVGRQAQQALIHRLWSERQ